MDKIKNFFSKIWKAICSFFINIFNPFFVKLGKNIWKGLRYVCVPIAKGVSWLFSFGATKAIASSVICVLIGLLAGFIVMLIRDPENCFRGLSVLITSGFSKKSSISHVLMNMTPMMLAGLSISFAFKLGLFNIGITGQLTMGAFLAFIVSFNGGNWLACMLVALLGGAAVGAISGILKAKFNVNEVLSGIMLNWIVYYLTSLIGQQLPENCIDYYNKAQLAKMGMQGRMPSLFGESSTFYGVTWGLIIAIVICLIFFFILKFTKFGFEMKLCGSNKYAAKYAGINQDQKIVLSLLLSGAIAGICGYLVFSNPSSPKAFTYNSLDGVMIADGFNGISVALIGQTDPIGCIFSAFFINYITEAQTRIVNVSILYSKYYMELIRAVIVYVASLSALFITLIRRSNIKHKETIDACFKQLFSRKAKEAK